MVLVLARSFGRSGLRRLAPALLALGLLAATVPAQASPPAPPRTAGPAASPATPYSHGGEEDPGLAAHESAEGLKLVSAEGETTRRDATSCTSSAPVRRYDIVAMAADITLNRYLDHDPLGRLYTLADDVDRVKAEIAANDAARAGKGEPAVTMGLQG
ncbi:MAG: hypothetical protein ACRDZW_07800, partial [Acidimicrobiales bacterium]